jgi:hypothetical protein
LTINEIIKEAPEMKETERSGASTENYEVDIFRPDDAPGVRKLFTAVYGDGYPVRIVYDPEQLVEAFEQQTNIPVVARTPHGEIVGYVAFYNSAPHTGLYELGQGLVRSDYRNLGVAGRNNHYAVEGVAPRFPMDAIFGEAVCNHIYMQRSTAQEGATATAIEVDLMPAEAYRKEESAQGRVSAIPMFKTIRPRPHKVYFPSCYERPLKFIYEGFNDERTLALSVEQQPQGPATRISTRYFDFAGVGRVSVFDQGRDCAEAIEREEGNLVGQGAQVIQVHLKLTCPWIGAIVEALRERDYFLGGALARWFDDDGLLMQKILGEPNWEGIHLFQDRARQILEYVHDDWEEVTG